MQINKSQMTQRVIGIDLHPDSFAAAQVTGHNVAEMVIERRYSKVPCDDWEKFLAKLPSSCTIVCEASSNSFEFMKIAEKFNHKAVVLNSKSVGQLAKAYCKNDPQDALRCAKVYLCGLAESIWMPDDETQLRREIYSSYQQAVTDQTRTNNRIKSFLCQHKIRLKTNQKIRQKSTRTYIMSAYNWSDSQKFILENLFESYDNASEKRTKYHQFIGKTVLETPFMTQLMQLCGIRMLTAYSIISAIGDIRRFSNPKKLVAYLGLAPKIIASGNFSASCGMMKGGKTYAKSSLVQAAHAVLKSKNTMAASLRTWGIKLKLKKNINVAVGAVARKLAVSIWYAMNGFFPDLLESEDVIRAKFKKIAQELRLDFVKSLGYKTTNDFIEEYVGLILLRRDSFYMKKLE